MRIYKFYKPGCHPCATLTQILKNVTLQNIEIVPVDITLVENQALIQCFNITKVPVLAISPEHKLEGSNKSAYTIERWIESYGN